MNIKLERKGFNALDKFFSELPTILKRASRSALMSTGNEGRKILKKYIESAGDGSFKARHPLRKKLKTSKSTGNWIKQTAQTPLKSLARFSRYWMENPEEVRISLRDTKDEHTAARSTKFDKQLSAILLKHEKGAIQRLTESMKDKLSVGIAKAGLKFIKKGTHQIVIPQRKIIEPVFKKAKVKLVDHYEKKLMLAIRRHEKEKLATA